jgi:hypothetical protein
MNCGSKTEQLAARFVKTHASDPVRRMCDNATDPGLYLDGFERWTQVVFVGVQQVACGCRSVIQNGRNPTRLPGSLSDF